MPVPVNSNIRIYRYDRTKKQFNRVAGGMRNLSVNDIFFSALDGDIIRDGNGNPLFVALTKPTIESDYEIGDDRVYQYYNMSAISCNVCIDTLLHARFNNHINILPMDIPMLYKDCDFGKPNKRFFRSKRCVSLLKAKRSQRMTDLIMETIIESVDVFIKKR
jgi:hypothetical protein